MRRVGFLALLVVLGVLVTAAGWLLVRDLPVWQARRTVAGRPSLEYYLYVPPVRDVSQRLPMVVAVHGTGSSGADMHRVWRAYAEHEGFVLVCPSFQPGYQRLEAGADADLTAILDEVAQTQPALRRPVFLVGFSGGAQFVHRWAFLYPHEVCGVAALSAGFYDPPPARARTVPFLVAVGSRDIGPPNRVTLAHWFHGALVQAGYRADLRVYDGVGHWLCAAAIEDTLAFYRAVRPGAAPR